MKRMEDLLEAATSRFRYDAGLREEIARELRAHLEDSIAAARADGMDEAQAEEAAVRAFGDPEEIGEKLWRANRRRLRRRAAALAAVGVVLMPACILAAAWFVTWLLVESIGPVRGLICIMTFALIYLLMRSYLPKAALLDLAYLRWLPISFRKSARIVFRTAWIWVPGLIVFGVKVSHELIMAWNNWGLHASNNDGWRFLGAGSLLRSIHDQLSQVHPRLPDGLPWLLLYLGYLLVAARIGRRLQSASGLDPSRARRWHIMFIASASGGVLLSIIGLPYELASWHLPIQFALLRNVAFPNVIMMLLDVASVPFKALFAALFFAAVLRLLRGQPLSLNGVLNSVFAVIGPMVWLFLIVRISTSCLSLVLWLHAPELSSLDKWWILAYQIAFNFIRLATAFLPAIIMSERCALRRACVRFGDFVRCHHWRYAAFIFLGALLLGLPHWATNAVLRYATASWSSYLWVTLVLEAIQITLQLVLTVMCFEFYLTRAGTIGPIVAEGVSPQVPSE